MKKTYPRLNPNPTLSESDCEEQYPAIDWREPLPGTGAGASGLICRYCMAMFGLGSSQLRDLPQTRAEFDEHMQEHLDNLKAQAEHKGKS